MGRVAGRRQLTGLLMCATGLGEGRDVTEAGADSERGESADSGDRADDVESDGVESDGVESDGVESGDRAESDGVESGDSEARAAGDRDGTELVLPFVVRIERAEPPTRTDALEAAARAVLLILTDPRPEWHEAVAAWDAQRIRKVVRRARGAEWHRASALDGLTVRQGSAQVRVFPPIPVDGWPRELARLQVGGTELDDVQPPPAPFVDTPLILVSPHHVMSAGKAMAQVAHAAQLGWRASSGDDRAAWRERGFDLAVRAATPSAWAAARGAGAPIVRDGGFTEVEPGAETALALLPWL